MLFIIAHHWNMIADEKLAKSKAINYLYNAAENATKEKKYFDVIDYYETIIDLLEIYYKNGIGILQLNCYAGLIYKNLGEIYTLTNQMNKAKLSFEESFDDYDAPKPTKRYIIDVITKNESISFSIKSGIKCLKRHRPYQIEDLEHTKDIIDLYKLYCETVN